MSERQAIAERRECDRFNFRHDGFLYTAAFSQYADGRLAEVFFQVAKSGTALEAVTRDAAILVSLCLQYGASEEAIRHSLTRLENDEPAGPVARFLDVLALGKRPRHEQA